MTEICQGEFHGHTQIMLASITILSSLLNSGPFHGWLAVQFDKDNGSLHNIIIISIIAVGCLLWNILFLLTIFVVMNLFLSSKMPNRNKMKSNLAYSHILA